MDDAIDENDELVNIDGTAQGLDVTPATVTIEDDDARGIAVSPTALQVPEGGDATYTVALRSQPTGPVTVTPSLEAGSSSDVTVSGVLTFTAADWDRAQTVTVSAAQDADAVNDTATVEHGVSGGGYGPVTAADVAVTVADDETASTGVTLTVSDEAVDEDAGATAITVTGALNGAPGTSDTAVTVTVSTGTASTEDFAAVADFTLTIAAGQTSGTASFTLTPVDDAIDENDELVNIDGTAQGLSVTGTSIAIKDNDMRGIAVSPTALQVPEGGDATYTVALKSEPTGPVTITPSVSGSPDLTVSGALTFTAEDWDRAQTVTVSGAQDADAANDRATVEHAVSGGGYGPVTAADVAVTVADDETASTGVTLTVSDEAVDEDAGATAITVTGALNGAPGTSDTAVTVSVSGGTASAGDFAAVQDFTLTIDAGETSGTASFTLTPVDDAIDEGDETVRVAGAAQGLEVTPATVTIEDDDARGIAVSTEALTVPEGGDATYTVALRSQPTGPVTVTPSVAGSPDVTVSGALTFTAETWDRAQTVTVSAAQDADAVNDTATVEHGVSGGGYGPVTAADVAVTVADDETASTGVTLTVSDEAVDEDAGATAITVTGALNGAPGTSDTAVTVTVSTGTASTEDFAAVADFTLTIAAGQTSGTASFTLTPVDDAIDENDELVNIDGTAQGLSVTGTSIAIKDNDMRGIAVSPTALQVPEGGDATYTVALRSQPTGPVTVTPSLKAGSSSDVTVSGVLTFTAADWDRAQTVTVAAAQDADAAAGPGDGRARGVGRRLRLGDGRRRGGDGRGRRDGVDGRDTDGVGRSGGRGCGRHRDHGDGHPERGARDIGYGGDGVGVGRDGVRRRLRGG